LGNGIFGQRFNRAGVSVGDEFQIDSSTTSEHRLPSVASLPDGGFVVVWESYYSGIFARRFDSAGAATGGEFQVNADAPYDYQTAPSVAADAAGRFVVVWSNYQDGSGRGVFGQRFDSLGTRLGPEFQVNTYTASYQYTSARAVAAAPDGSFVVVWTSLGQDGYGPGVFTQRFDSAGAAVGAEMQVNTDTAGSQHQPAVDVSADGSFVVVWGSHAGTDNRGIFGRRYDSTGASIGGEFQISVGAPGYDAEVAAADDGSFVVLWSDYSNVIGRGFDSLGAPVGSAFQVNTGSSGGGYAFYTRAPAVAYDTDRFVVVWESYGQDGSQFGVFGRRFLGVPGSPSGAFLDATADPLS
jgi:hypothetical protein